MLNWRSWVTNLTLPLATVAIGGMMLSLPSRSLAAPAKVFVPFLERIQQDLPASFAMRLPQQIQLGYPADDEFIGSLQVRVLASDAPEGLTVGLYSRGQESHRCRIGTFAVVSANSAIAQQTFRQHRVSATPIQLTDDIRGYVLEHQSEPTATRTVSIMWRQDGLFYTIEFAAPERQNMLYMAVSMANNEPIYALNTALRGVPARTATDATAAAQWQIGDRQFQKELRLEDAVATD